MWCNLAKPRSALSSLEGSAAGTWLNYAPVSKNGAHLEHGDVVQFGKATFRFEQLGSETKKLKVIPLGDER